VLVKSVRVIVKALKVLEAVRVLIKVVRAILDNLKLLQRP
jgi:hypothetical protein